MYIFSLDVKECKAVVVLLTVTSKTLYFLNTQTVLTFYLYCISGTVIVK